MSNIDNSNTECPYPSRELYDVVEALKNLAMLQSALVQCLVSLEKDPDTEFHPIYFLPEDIQESSMGGPSSVAEHLLTLLTLPLEAKVMAFSDNSENGGCLDTSLPRIATQEETLQGTEDLSDDEIADITEYLWVWIPVSV